MTVTYTPSYSVFPNSPAQYGFAYFELAGNSTFAWPENNSGSQFVLAQQMYVTADDSSYQFIFPPANLVGVGRTFQIFNNGSLAFTIYSNTGISLATITTGQLYQCTVGDNSTTGGVWEVLLLGTGSSGADANALAGYGLSSLTNSKLNTNLPETIITTAYTVLPADRGSVLSYTGGTNTITLPIPVDGFIVGLINNSTVGGLLTLQPPMGYTINNDSNLTLSPGDSTFITGGANYNAIGIGRLNITTESLLQLDVSASINVTLSAAQSGNSIIIFTGALANAINVYLTPVQVNKYDIYNNTTGGYSITVSVVGGMNSYAIITQQTDSYFTDVTELYNVPNNIGPVGGAAFWVSSANSFLPNEINFGLLPKGLVGINVASSIATPYTVPFYTNSTSPYNLFFGPGSVPSLISTGSNNLVVGVNSASGISTGENNTALGFNALYSCNTGNSNTAGGSGALFYCESAQYNTAFGNNALYNNIADDNTSVGFASLLSNTTGTGNAAHGFSALYSNTTGNSNTAAGYAALYNNTTGANNSSFGFSALYNNTTGDSNSAMGYNSLTANTTGVNNSSFGFTALYRNTTGNNCTATGVNALYSNTTASDNVASGFNALYNNTTGANHTASGSNALYSNTTGTNNAANGYYALYSNTTGSSNAASGYYALYSNTTGLRNSGFGSNALYLNTTGINNTASGYASLNSNTTGTGNSAHGMFSLFANTTGANNTAFGYNSGSTYADNTQCVFIGASADSSISTLTNAMAIGYGASVKDSNTAVIGSGITGVGVNSISNLIVVANNSADGTVNTVTLNGTTNVTVSTTACLTTSLVFLTPITNGTPTNNGVVSVNSIANGSFNVVSNNALDNSVVQWFVVNPV